MRVKGALSLTFTSYNLSVTKAVFGRQHRPQYSLKLIKTIEEPRFQLAFVPVYIS